MFTFQQSLASLAIVATVVKLLNHRYYEIGVGLKNVQLLYLLLFFVSQCFRPSCFTFERTRAKAHFMGTSNDQGHWGNPRDGREIVKSHRLWDWCWPWKCCNAQMIKLFWVGVCLSFFVPLYGHIYYNTYLCKKTLKAPMYQSLESFVVNYQRITS